jgi:hypothetical protein
MRLNIKYATTALFPVFLVAACSSKSGVPAAGPKPLEGEDVTRTRVDCTPPILFQKLVPSLTSALNDLPAGGTLEAVLTGSFPATDEGACMLDTALEIQRGEITINCENGTVVYRPNGRRILNWRTRSQTVQENNKPPPLSIVIDRKEAYVGLPMVRLLSGEYLPTADSRDFFFLPSIAETPSARREFVLRITKSPDCINTPVSFRVVRPE